MIPAVSGCLAPTAAVTGQMPALVNSSVSTPSVGTTVLVVPPSVAIVPSPSVAAIPPVGTIVSEITPSVAATLPVGTVASVAPSSVASSLPVGTSVSLSSASLSQPSYQPLVVVNTPQIVRPYNGLRVGPVFAIILRGWRKLIVGMMIVLRRSI